MSKKLIQVSPGKVKIVNNVRTTIDKTNINDLAKSIKQNGLIQPITIVKKTKTTYKLIIGQRRLLASRKAKMQKIPAILEDAEENMLIKQLVENIDREDMNPMEIATSYLNMIENDGMTVKEISQRSRMSMKKVKSYLRINNLIPQLQKEVIEGYLPIEGALILAKFNSNIQEDFTDARYSYLINDPKRLENYIINNYSGDLSRVNFDLNDPDLNPDMGPCQGCKFSTSTNKDLFDTKENRCSNLECFQIKQINFLKNRMNDLGGVGNFYLIADRHVQDESINDIAILSINEYEVVKHGTKKEQEATIYPGLFVAGPNYGKVIDIVLVKELKKIEKAKRDKVFKEGKKAEMSEAVKGNIYLATPDERFFTKIEKKENEINGSTQREIRELIDTIDNLEFNIENVTFLFCLLMNKVEWSLRNEIAKELKCDWDFQYEDVIKKKLDITKLLKIIFLYFINYKDNSIKNDWFSYKTLIAFTKENFGSKTLKQITDKANAKLSEYEIEQKAKFEKKWARKPKKL